jgi:hypothetical protein
MPFATVGKLHNSRQLPIKNAIELPKLQKNIFPRHKKVAMTQKKKIYDIGGSFERTKMFFCSTAENRDGIKMFFYAPEESCGVTKKFFCRSPESCDGIKRVFSMAPELKRHCMHPGNSAPRSPAKATIKQPCLFPRPDGSGGFRDRGWCRRMEHGGFGNRYGEPAVFSPANALPAFAGSALLGIHLGLRIQA